MHRYCRNSVAMIIWVQPYTNTMDMVTVMRTSVTISIKRIYRHTRHRHTCMPTMTINSGWPIHSNRQPHQMHKCINHNRKSRKRFATHYWINKMMPKEVRIILCHFEFSFWFLFFKLGIFSCVSDAVQSPFHNFIFLANLSSVAKREFRLAVLDTGLKCFKRCWLLITFTGQHITLIVASFSQIFSWKHQKGIPKSVIGNWPCYFYGK